MIGKQKTGRLPGVIISQVADEPPTLTIDGQPGVLAVLSADGSIVVSGGHVASEVAAVCVKCYRSMLDGKGHVRVWGEPIADGVLVSQVAHEWPSVIIAGQPGSLAVLTECGVVAASGAAVAAEMLSVAVNCHRDVLMARGRLKKLCCPGSLRAACGVQPSQEVAA